VRVQILRLLLLNGRSDIGTIAEQLPQDRSVISRHLNSMYNVGILAREKETRHIYYAIEARTLLKKINGIADRLRAWMIVCCPDRCQKE